VRCGRSGLSSGKLFRRDGTGQPQERYGRRRIGLVGGATMERTIMANPNQNPQHQDDPHGKPGQQQQGSPQQGGQKPGQQQQQDPNRRDQQGGQGGQKR